MVVTGTGPPSRVVVLRGEYADMSKEPRDEGDEASMSGSVTRWSHKRAQPSPFQCITWCSQSEERIAGCAEDDRRVRSIQPGTADCGGLGG